MRFGFARLSRRRILIPVLAVLGLTGGGAGYVATDQRGEPAGPDDRRELVVLVHGMGRTRASMWLLGRSLESRGYRVLNWGYNSYADTVPALGHALAREVDEAAAGAPRVHFVGHSLGTVVIRWTLANQPPARMGRVVMLAPPNQGARRADLAAPYVDWLLPPIRELRTAKDATARALPPPTRVDVGVIAGSEDGTVRVSETHLPGEREHVLVPAGHTFIMLRGDVRTLVPRFLRTGTFGPAARPADAKPAP